MGRLLIWTALLLALMAGLGFFYAAYEAQRAGPVIAQARSAATFSAQTGLAWVNLPDNRQQLLLTVEDPNFFHHNGLDFTTPGVGRATITQSLADAIVVRPPPPGLAPLRRAIIAREIDRRMPKDEQLTLYLNIAPLGVAQGRRIYGFPDAAQAYFGVNSSDLAEAQFVNLTARLIDPDRFSRRGGEALLARRLARIERLMLGSCAPAHPFDDTYPGCT